MSVESADPPALDDDADASKVAVNSYVPITIRMPDSSGKPHEAESVRLLVMPTLSVDVIIGLPHLVRNFPQCFTSHLMAAIIASHTPDATVITSYSIHYTKLYEG